MSDTTRTFKSHLPDTDFTDKTTSSLEQDFKKFSLEPSNYSFTSTPSSVLSSERYCQHTKVISQENFDSCFNCGAYVSQNGVKTLKPKNMSFLTFFPPKTIYEAMTKRSFPLRKSMNQEYVEIRQAHVDWILELAEKLKISINTTHLAIHLLDFMMFHHPSLTPKIQLFAPVCLLVASKTVELDERIPFIPRLRRYTNSTYGVQDYTKAELQVLDAVDWNAQLSSPLEINEFLLCQGVVFSNDDFEEKENPNGKGQSGPEGLREISQYENTNYLGNKNNLANRISTNNAENYPNKPVNHALEDDFPAATQLARYHSTPGHVENHYQSPQTKVCMEKRIEEVLVNLENNYVRISTLLLKDADFVEWEPKVVSAATIAFLRSTNHINPVWNPELEAIASLKFSQIAGCYNLIKKRYNSLFTSNRNRYQRASSTLENNPNTPTTSHNNQTSDYKAPADEHDPNSRFSEQKSNSNYVKLPASSYEPPLRDDSHYKVRYGNGTITTEIPHKNGQTAAENYQSDPSHFQNHSASYYNASVNGTVNGGANMENYHDNGYRPSPQYDTYHQNGAFSYQNVYVPQASHRINGMHENGLSYQPRLDVLKK